jgi:arylsulfatase A-like enzyme
MTHHHIPTSDRSALPVTDVITLALAGALLATWVENGTSIVQRVFLHRLSGATTGFLWVVPLSYLLIFTMVGIGLALVTRFTSASTAVRLSVATCGALVAFVALFLGLYGRMNQWALVLLATGIGVQLGRVAGARARATVTRARKFVVVAGMVTIIPAVGNPMLQRWIERRAGGAERPPAGAPNVLLIILDTVRAASLSLYGNPDSTTPNLDRWARRGVVFDHAYATAPWTLPSHASMFTGLYPHQLTTDWRIPMYGDAPTLAEAFRDRGYRTGGIVANLFYNTEESGLARGFVHYEDYLHTPAQLRRSTALGQFLDTWKRRVKPTQRTFARKSAAVINRQFLSWLDRDPGRPFFAFLNYYDAHQPYLFDPRLLPQFKSDNELEERYEAAIASLDREVSRLIDSLEQRGILGNTIILISADHGEHLGDHKLEGHGNSLYTPLLHIPLLLLFGDHVPAGLRVAQRVTLRDLPMTVTRLAGLDAPFPGSPLSRFWDSALSGNAESPVLSGVSRGIRTAANEPVTKGPMKSLIVEDLHYILNGDGREELYDLKQDPGEDRDLAPATSDSAQLRRLREGLKQEIRN